ncbi:hypothetical protein [Bacillus sp. T33-2]|uniref:hypothetical protein n=1 Tax=Bacillus sp. T33-2 TaxID=2054168 RepID=UPI000C77676D|nr:hypothetical protein [Bacillus sp. T33-2]PLR96943.1 hypothetical protein CVD19_10180 [Bacillus sp. T33-2]
MHKKIALASLVALGFAAAVLLTKTEEKVSEPEKRQEPYEIIEREIPQSKATKLEEYEESEESKEIAAAYSEFGSFEGYVSSIHSNWSKDSELRSVWADEQEAELHMVTTTLRYAIHFKNEIELAGLEDLFDELENIGVLMYAKPENYQELANKFGETLNTIRMEMDKGEGPYEPF